MQVMAVLLLAHLVESQGGLAPSADEAASGKHADCLHIASCKHSMYQAE